MGENNDDRIREVVDNIITHPSFRQTLSNILNQSPTITAASDTSLSSNQLSRPTTTRHNSSLHSTPVHQSNSSINSNRNLRVAEHPLFNVVLAIAKVQELADGQQVCHTQEHLIITIDLEGEKKYLDQNKLYYCPIQRRIGLYVRQRKLILWSTGLFSVKLELIKIGQIRRFFNIFTDALKKSLEARTFRLWRLEQLLFQHGRLPVCFTQILTLLKNS